MSRLSSSDQESPQTDVAGAPPCANGRNGTAAECAKTEAAGADAQAQDPSHLDRVEAIMDDVGKKVGEFTSKLGVHLFRLVAHSREAAEDCWAEAQSIRRGESQEEKSSPTS